MIEEAGQPVMPAGYGLSGDPAGRLDWGWAVERLTAARGYWLATTRPDGRPHVMPVWGLWLAGLVCFSTDPGSRKGRNLAADPRVVVHLESADEVVIVEGTASPLGRGPLLAEFVTRYADKYAVTVEPGDGIGIFAVRPAVVLAWREADFPRSASRWTARPEAQT